MQNWRWVKKKHFFYNIPCNLFYTFLLNAHYAITWRGSDLKTNIQKLQVLKCITFYSKIPFWVHSKLCVQKKCFCKFQVYFFHLIIRWRLLVSSNFWSEFLSRLVILYSKSSIIGMTCYRIIVPVFKDVFSKIKFQ